MCRIIILTLYAHHQTRAITSITQTHLTPTTILQQSNMSQPLLDQIQQGWESYNDERSWRPFVLPLLLWSSTYIYTRTRSDKTHPLSHKWHEWNELHNIHNVGSLLLALVSLYFHSNAILNERVVILWNFSYFCVDLIDTTTRRDVPFILHALFCLACGTFNYTTPVCRVLRMNSKAALLEASSPFLHLAKRTKAPLHFVAFAVMFTLCRMVWIPVIISQLLASEEMNGWKDWRVLLVCAFYGLNVYWYLQILKILWTGGKKTKSDKTVVEEGADKKEQ